MLFKAIKALVYGSLFAAFWAILALETRSLDSRIDFQISPWVKDLGSLLIILGGFIALVCISTFLWIGNGTPAPFDPPKEFVVTGPYKYVRNPMYIGGFIALFGFALYNRSVSMLFFTILAIIISQIFLIFFEEKSLEKRFGGSYLDYKKSVNRWLPRTPKLSR